MPALASSSSTWRGRSSRTYRVGVFLAEDFASSEMQNSVCIAVARGTGGIAEAVSVTGSLTGREAASWLRRATDKGATEIHVHKLRNGNAERDAVVRDLKPGVR